MITEEEFEGYRTEHARAWKPFKKSRDLYPVLRLTPERQQAILEAALAKLHTYREDYSYTVYGLAQVLLGAGVSASDEVICEWLEAQAAARHPFSSFPTDEFVRWVEHQEVGAGISVRLLTCLRKHLPLISRRATDKKHRALMRRMAVALKLVENEVIPEVKDAWTSRALAWRDSLPDEPREKWTSLLELANTQHSNKPGKTYLTQARELIAELPQFFMIMRDILECIGRDGPVNVRFRGYSTSLRNLLDEDFTDLLRALVWLCADCPDLSSLLRDAAERCSIKIRNIGPLCAKIATACAEVLSRQEALLAVPALAGLQKAAKHKTTKKGLAKAIRNLEQESGAQWAALEETMVPDFGFSDSNNPNHRIGDYRVRLSFLPNGRPQFVWDDGTGCSTSTPPAAIRREHQDGLKETKVLLREVTKAWKNQSLRLERLMCQGREIPAVVWQRHYLHHPIVGSLCTRLLWKSGATLFGFHEVGNTPVDRAMTTIEGLPVTLKPEGTVRLWHPAELSAIDRQSWEKWVLEKRLIQPFQQALRETHHYEKTSEGVADVRYLGQRLHQGTFAALCRERGWTYSFHGTPAQFEPFIGFQEAGVRGALTVAEEPDPTGRSLIWLRVVKVSFYAEGNNKPLVLSSVPPVIFSEFMRDVGLFIAASSSAHDTGWRETIPTIESGK